MCFAQHPKAGPSALRSRENFASEWRTGTPTRVRNVRELDEPVQEIFTMALAPDQDDRPARRAEFGDAMRRCGIIARLGDACIVVLLSPAA